VIERLGIENFALIDRVTIDLSPGLNALTGETGAGKSIILGALDLLLGARASTDIIRAGSDSARVEGLFILPEGPARKALEELDLTEEDPAVMLVRRTVPESGRGRITINGQMATNSMLKSVTRHLVDMSSQHAHYALLDAHQHLLQLDRFGGLEGARSAFQDEYQTMLTLIAEREALIAAERERLEREDFLRFQLEEIETAEPQPEEDAALELEVKRLQHAEKLQAGISQAEQVLSGTASAAAGLTARAENEIRVLTGLDEALNPLLARVESARLELEDISYELAQHGRHIVHNPRRLQDADDRLALLRKLLRKHGPELTDVLRRAQDMRDELERFASAEQRIETLAGEIAERRDALLEKGRKLSKKRRTTGKRLAKAVEAELTELAMQRCALRVAQITREENLGPNGIDHIEFELAPNPGEGFLSLAKCASGGELSRILLALKAVMIKSDPVSSSIFDEVDAGVGGGVAEVIGQKLKLASAERQVLCITHLPQIAAYADHHLHVIKITEDGRTTTSVQHLTGEERLLEIARMLGGIELTETTREHAEEMLGGSQAWAPRAA